MEKLDHHREMFAQGLALGFTAFQAAQEAALDLTQVEAQMMSQEPEIRRRVSEIIKLDDYDQSNEHLRIARQLEIDRDFAYQVGNPAAAINAAVQRAKLLGHFVERTETTNNVAVRSGAELTPDEWAAKFGVGKSAEDE